MAPIPIPFVVSFTSQDDRHPADNLLRSDCENDDRWQCSSENRNASIEVELQFLQPFKVTRIDVGNYGSATVEILAGLSSWPKSREFVSLLPTSMLMTPADSKSMENRNNVRIFTQEFLNLENRLRTWDRVRIVCSQPYLLNVPYGLNFIKFHSDDEAKKEITLDDDDSVYASFAWEKLKGLKSSVGVTEPPVMSRSANAVLKSVSKLQRSNSHVSSIENLELRTFKTVIEDVGGNNDKACQSSTARFTTPRRRKKRKLDETVSQDSSTDTEKDNDFFKCPICSTLTPKNEIELHVNGCLDNAEASGSAPCPIPNERLLPRAVSIVPENEELEISRLSWVECPLCAKEYEGWFISNHINVCVPKDRRKKK